ncbi:MAG: DMT family transporter [Burkholderiaceae bacterium]
MSALWMVVAAFLFSIMGACVKLAGRDYGIAEIVFYRSIIGVLILFIFVRFRGLSLATPRATVHLRRSLNGTAALALWFYATKLLPLGTAMTLSYASSLYLAAAVIGVALHRRQHVDIRLTLAVLVGFVGVLLVLQPSFSSDQGLAALAGLFSGIFAAVAYWHVRELGQLGEPEWRTVLYFSMTGSLLGLSGSLISGFSPHTFQSALVLVAVGLSALLAQLALTRALGSRHTLLVANLQYSSIVFASIFGMALFDDRIPMIAWAGMTVIIVSAIAASSVTARRRGAEPAEIVDVEPAAER